jgi:hypothetical protein
MSQRRCSLLPRFCCRRLSAMNLSNAEVNGINVRKSKSLTSRARYEQHSSTPMTTKWILKKKHFNRKKTVARYTFKLRFNEAKSFEDRGAYGKAEGLYNQLIRFCEHSFGADRYETGIPLNQLALLHFRRGRLELAKPLFERSLKILIRTRGVNHRHTRTVTANLVDLDFRKSKRTFPLE